MVPPKTLFGAHKHERKDWFLAWEEPQLEDHLCTGSDVSASSSSSNDCQHIILHHVSVSYFASTNTLSSRIPHAVVGWS